VLGLRIVTAAVLAPAFVAGIWLLSEDGFALLVGAIGGIAAAEWGRLCGFGRVGTALYAAALVALGGVALASDALEVLVAAGAGWWLVAAVMVMVYPRGDVIWVRPWGHALIGGVAMLPGWAGFVLLQAHVAGPGLLLWVLVLVWAADIGAYFAGHAFGRRKLAPAVSPGKTWEGVAGGALLALLVGVVGALAAGLEPRAWPAAGALVLVLLAASVVGDLAESIAKRTAGGKDSSRMLPGHGGVLDRIDSLLAAVPVAALVLAGWGGGA